MKKYFLLLILSLLANSLLHGDALTVDPPVIWDTECANCLPRCPPSACLPVFDKDNPTEEISLDLLNPIYQDGTIWTEEGGVLCGQFLRIQAQKIIHTRRLEGPNPQYTVYCEGNLLIDYKDRVFAGHSLYYDFLTHTGTIICGKMAAFPWFLGGEEIFLCADGSIVIRNGYVTTSEGGEKAILVHAPEIRITQDLIVTGTDVTFQIKEIPVMWLPKGSFDIKATTESPLAFNFGWNGFLGTHFGVKYHFLTLGAFKGYARADGYLGRGLGVGFESEYDPKCSPTEFYTRNYYAHDLSIDDPQKKDRYRVQGTYYSDFFDERTSLEFLYDFVSDAQMAADYETHDFELNPAQRTELNLRQQECSWIANLYTRVKVNNFQTVNQELPIFEMTLHPFEIGPTGIIAENLFNFGYLSYSFSKDIKKAKDFHSGRFEVRPRIYRPFPLRFLKITPQAKFVGIAYTNSPSRHSVGQALFDGGVLVDTTMARFIGPFKHTVIPYLDYHFITQPRVDLDNHYLFTIEDAYAKLNLLRFGMRHLLYFSPSCLLSPLRIDIWGNAFFDAKPIPVVVQKGYLNLDWQPLPRIFCGLDGSWNFQDHVLDFINMRFEWTFNENIALAGEWRHRSPFAWRKNDFYNFLLEAVREQPALLASPLSDRRDTLLGRIFCRVTPDFAVRLEVRNGWNRIDQPHYMEYLAQAETTIFQHWRFLFTYEKREEDNRYSVALKLDPGAPSKRKAKLARL